MGENMKKLAVSFVLVVVLACSAQAQFPPPASLSPSTTKATYLIGEPVGLILTNVGSLPGTWMNPGYIKQDCFVYDSAMQLVFDGNQVFVLPYLDPVTILPGHSATTYWDQSYIAWPKQGQVPPGVYYFKTTGWTGPKASFQIVVPEPSTALSFGGLAILGTVALRRRFRLTPRSPG